jgi:hypothetical protein
MVQRQSEPPEKRNEMIRINTLENGSYAFTSLFKVPVSLYVPTLASAFQVPGVSITLNDVHRSTLRCLNRWLQQRWKYDRRRGKLPPDYRELEPHWDTLTSDTAQKLDTGTSAADQLSILVRQCVFAIRCQSPLFHSDSLDRLVAFFQKETEPFTIPKPVYQLTYTYAQSGAAIRGLLVDVFCVQSTLSDHQRLMDFDMPKEFAVDVMQRYKAGPPQVLSACGYHEHEDGVTEGTCDTIVFPRYGRGLEGSMPPWGGGQKVSGNAGSGV